jgi:outer membrane receptor protein involved in Fe transport
MKFRLFVSFLLCFLSFSFFAQKGHLIGKVVDEKSNSPILYVTVSLQNILDSSLVSGVITDEQGRFKIQNIILDKSYLLKFSFIGYKTYFKRIDFSNEKSIDLGDIFISPSVELLKGLEVMADKPMVTYEIDKKVVNVEQMNTVTSQTAVQVLANITSVTVDIDGNVSLRGSQGFTLLIDGRPSAMPNSEALQLIQASNIKDIEIITNPSAKYDAEGTAGIINIILKKNILQGVSTLINVNGGNSANGSDYLNYGADFLTSINKEKLKFNIGGQWVDKNRFRDIEQIRKTEISGEEYRIESQGLHRYFGTNYGGNAAMEYQPNESNFLSVGLSANTRQWNAAANYTFDEFIEDSLVNSYQNRERTLRDFLFLSSSLAYQHLFNKDKEHYISLTSTYNLYDGKEDAQAEFFNENESLEGGNRNTEVGPTNAVRLSVDYQLPLENKMKLQLGARADFGFSGDDQDSYRYDIFTQEYIRLDSFSTDVKYTQNVFAGYGIINGKLNEKLGYQIGFRAEYTDRYISLTNSSLNASINRLDWFPSAHFSYKVNSKNQFMANASRRINRPRSWHLEPFISWEDPYTVRQGNPNLLPEYIQSYEFGYIRELKKGSFSSEFYFRNIKNMRQRIQEVYDVNVIVKRPVNAGVSQSLGGEFTFSNKVVDWWSLDLGLNLFYYKVEGDALVSTINQESFTYRGRLSNSLILPSDFKIQFITNFIADVVTVQGMDKGYTTFDLAIKKDFRDGRASATFQFSNIFASERRETIIDTPLLYSYRLATPRWPFISLSLSVRLNNFNNLDKIKTEKGSEF